MAGQGRNRARPGAGGESRSDFVKRQHKEREARELKRTRDKAATCVQAVWRGYWCLKVARNAQRHIFDKRGADIAKVTPVLPPETKAKFIYKALTPMLRLFAFFFTAKEDSKRMSVLKDLVIYSAGQDPSNNIAHLAIADDDAQRQSFLVLFEKLLSAALRLGASGETMQLLLALQAALFTLPDRRPLHESKSGAAVGHILRRTSVLSMLSKSFIPGAQDEQSVSQALGVTLLCFAGLEACGQVERQQPLVCLFSAPRFGELLCRSQGALPQECLRRLVGLLPDAPPAGALQALLSEAVDGSPRQRWLLTNFAAVLEGHLMRAGDEVERQLPLWVNWLCWVKEQAAETQPEGWAVDPMSRLYASSCVRALIQAAERQGPEGLLAVCRLYFSPADSSGAGTGEPPPEVLQTLAFATPLAERLFPAIIGLIRGLSIEAVYEMLGPPMFRKPEAVYLRIFCSVYAMQMQPMYDYEFFGTANPLRIEEVQVLTLFLNRLAYHFVTNMPNKSALEPTGKALRSSLTSLVCLLYNRHCRRKILQGDTPWVIAESRLLIRRAPVVDLGTDDRDALVEDDDHMDVEEPESSRPSTPAGFGAAAAAGLNVTGLPREAFGAPGSANAEQQLEAVLDEIPHVLPFSDRVELLHNVIQNDQAQRRETRGPWAQAARQPHQIRRNSLVEDGFGAFEKLTDEGGLRDVFRVEFIAPDGQPESGVDGGGLFKEFMVTVNRAMFDPQFGLFSTTTDQTLYPSVTAFVTNDRAADLYTFLGKVVGKAIYEMFLLEAQFSRVFLNRLLGRTNEVDDVAALDRDLHHGMLKIKESASVEAFDLTFSVTNNQMGHFEEVDLISNGRNTPVTKDNLTRYFHLMANYKTNVQFHRQTVAFLRGVQCVVPLAWLKMFDPYELNVLISGSDKGFDVADLQRNTNLSGGYQDDSPVIQWLWQILEHHLDPEDMGRFLMFATSCSRAPLLGFKTLSPAFCIHRVPDGVRLPTASTCANLLKLPDYPSPEVLKFKLLQAIRAEAGFDLS